MEHNGKPSMCTHKKLNQSESKFSQNPYLYIESWDKGAFLSKLRAAERQYPVS